jgi:hypothetical protein
MHGRGWPIKEVAAATSEHRIPTKEHIAEQKRDVAIDMPLGAHHLALDPTDANGVSFIHALGEAWNLSCAPSKAHHTQSLQAALLLQFPIDADVVAMCMSVENGAQLKPICPAVVEGFPGRRTVHCRNLSGLKALNQPDKIVLCRGNLMHTEASIGR